MLTMVPPAQRRAAKQQLLADLQNGYSVQETQTRVAILCHPATIYRLRQRRQTDPVIVDREGMAEELLAALAAQTGTQGRAAVPLASTLRTAYAPRHRLAQAY